MADLHFEVTGVAPVEFAAAPMLGFQLAVSNRAGPDPIQGVTLRVQIQFEVARRNYSASEKSNLLDLFGEPGRWGQTLRPLLWTHVQTSVPPFSGRTLIELQVPCTFDFNVAATKYFYGLETGEIPLTLLFSGTVFEADPLGVVRVSPIPWDKETRFRLPLAAWRDMMDAYYPNTAWLCLRRDAFEHLMDYKTRHGIPTWEIALERLLAEASRPAPL
jgi:Family of unknown function (DUF6084)